MDLHIHTDEETLVILGVDTHADAHVAVALDGLGRRLGHKTVPSTEAGYAALVGWAEEFGTRWPVPASRAAAASAWGWPASCAPEV